MLSESAETPCSEGVARILISAMGGGRAERAVGTCDPSIFASPECGRVGRTRRQSRSSDIGLGHAEPRTPAKPLRHVVHRHIIDTATEGVKEVVGTMTATVRLMV